MKWIKERRRRLGITQDDLAARMQINGYSVEAGAISHWETGKRRPPLNDQDFINALAVSLKLDIQSVLKLSGYALVQTHSPLGERAAAIVDAMPDSKKRIAVKILETLNEE